MKVSDLEFQTFIANCEMAKADLAHARLMAIQDGGGDPMVNPLLVVIDLMQVQQTMLHSLVYGMLAPKPKGKGGT